MTRRVGLATYNRGRSICTVVPCPGSLVTAIVPLYAFMMGLGVGLRDKLTYSEMCEKRRIASQDVKTQIGI
jgi:hypothetical protein